MPPQIGSQRSCDIVKTAPIGAVFLLGGFLLTRGLCFCEFTRCLFGFTLGLCLFTRTTLLYLAHNCLHFPNDEPLKNVSYEGLISHAVSLCDELQILDKLVLESD